MSEEHYSEAYVHHLEAQLERVREFYESKVPRTERLDTLVSEAIEIACKQVDKLEAKAARLDAVIVLVEVERMAELAFLGITQCEIDSAMLAVLDNILERAKGVSDGK